MSIRDSLIAVALGATGGCERSGRRIGYLSWDLFSVGKGEGKVENDCAGAAFLITKTITDIHSKYRHYL